MVAILCLTPAGERLARRLAETVGGAIHGRAGRTGAPVLFDDTLGHIRALFAAGTPIVGICAAGILIRAVAPLLSDKRSEPPVVAVAEDGSAVVPLLGGHRGANALARRAAAGLGVTPAITTAGDLALGVALDEPPLGWRLADPAAAKPVMAGLLAGEPFRLSGAAGPLADPLADRLADPLAAWLAPVAALPNVSACPGAGRGTGAAVVLAPEAGGLALA